MSATAIENPAKRESDIDDEKEKRLKRARIQRKKEKITDLLESDDLNSQLKGLSLFENSEFISLELRDRCLPIILKLLSADYHNEQLLEGALDAFSSLIHSDFTTVMRHPVAAKVLKKLCSSQSISIADTTIRTMALASRYSQENVDVIISSGFVDTLLDLATCKDVFLSVRWAAIESLAIFFVTKGHCTWYQEQARKVLREMNTLLLEETCETILLKACTTMYYVLEHEDHKLVDGIAKDMLCSLVKLLKSKSHNVIACAIRAITRIVTSDAMQMEQIDSEAFSRIRDYFMCYDYMEKTICDFISLLTIPRDIEAMVNQETIIRLMDLLGGGDSPCVKAAAANAISNVLHHGSKSLLTYVIGCMPSAIVGGSNNHLKRVIACIWDVISSGSHDLTNEDKIVADAYVNVLWGFFDYARKAEITDPLKLEGRLLKLVNSKKMEIAVGRYKEYLMKHYRQEYSEEAEKNREISVLP